MLPPPAVSRWPRSASRLLGVLAASIPLACGAGVDLPAPPDRCPSWDDDVVAAPGSLVLSAEGATLPDAQAWRVGVKVAAQPGGADVLVTACTVEVTERRETPPGADPFCIWEPEVFAGTWRLEGPIDAPTAVAGATSVGRPGMAAGLSTRALDCGPEITQEITDLWEAYFNGASELVVTRWSAAAQALASSGWVLSDGATPRRVDLALEVSW